MNTVNPRLPMTPNSVNDKKGLIYEKYESYASTQLYKEFMLS